MEAHALLIAGLAVAAFLEGLPCFIAPGAVRESARWIAERGDTTLRRMGLCLMVGGLVLAWLLVRAYGRAYVLG